MSSQRSKEIQVGIMVVIGIVVLVAGVMFFKRVDLRTNMQPYAVDVAAVEGLRQGDRVQVRGVRKGRVTGFEFRTGFVRINLELEDNVELHDDADVILVSKGLVGEMLLEIEPGRGRLVEPGHVFTGRSATSMLALGDKMTAALDVMTGLGAEVRALIKDLRDQGHLIEPLAAAEHALVEAGAMLAENRESLRQLIRGLADLTETLQGTLAGGQLDSTLATARHAAASLDHAMMELSGLMERGHSLLESIEEGEGTLGRLMTDETLYDSADDALQSLERLLDQMRRNPKAFFKISVF